MKHRFALVFCCLLLSILCSAQESMIAVSASARSTGMRGYGITLFLENLETHEIYKSKSLGALSENAVLEHIPAGMYEVCLVEIPFGDRKFWNESPELRSFFGTIEVLPDKNYYLGRYTSKLQGKLSSRQVVMNLDSHEMPEKLVKYIEGQGLVADDFTSVSPTGESFVLAQFSELTSKFLIGGVR